MSTSAPSLDDIRNRATIPVPIAGAMLGLSKTSSYRAAQEGQLPTIRLGRRLVVPVPRFLAMLEGETHDAA